MALHSIEKYKVVRSIARWLAGLSPTSGYRYYFEKYSSASRVIERLKPYRGLRICPFCGKRFLRPSAFVSHILRLHVYDLEELLDRG